MDRYMMRILLPIDKVMLRFRAIIESNILENDRSSISLVAAISALSIDNDFYICLVIFCIVLFAIDRQLEVSILIYCNFFQGFDVSEKIDGHFAAESLRRIHSRLKGLILSGFIGDGDLSNCADESIVNISIALGPNITISREQLGKVIDCYSNAILRAVMQREVKAACLCMDLEIAVERTTSEFRIDICSNGVIARFTKGYISKCDLIHAAIRSPATESAAGDRDGAAGAAINVERIRRRDIAVLDHDIGAAALAEHAAEGPADGGVLDGEGGRRRQSLHQDRAVPSGLASASHDDVVNNDAIGTNIDQSLIAAGSDLTAINGHVFDRDIRIADRHSTTGGGLNLDRRVIFTGALQSNASRDHRSIRDLMIAGNHVHRVAADRFCQSSHNRGIIRGNTLFGDRRHDDHRGVGGDAFSLAGGQHVALGSNGGIRKILAALGDLDGLTGSQGPGFRHIAQQGDGRTVGLGHRVHKGSVLLVADLGNVGTLANRVGVVVVEYGYNSRALRDVLLRILGEGTAGDDDGTCAFICKRAFDRTAGNIDGAAALNEDRVSVVARSFDGAAGNIDRASTVCLYHDGGGGARARSLYFAAGDVDRAAKDILNGRNFFAADSLDLGVRLDVQLGSIHAKGRHGVVARNGHFSSALKGGLGAAIICHNGGSTVTYRDVRRRCQAAAGDNSRTFVPKGRHVVRAVGIDSAAGHGHGAYVIDRIGNLRRASFDRAAIDRQLTLIINSGNVVDLDAAAIGGLDRQLAGGFHLDRVVDGAGDLLAVQVQGDGVGNDHLLGESKVLQQLDFAAGVGVDSLLQGLIAGLADLSHIGTVGDGPSAGFAGKDLAFRQEVIARVAVRLEQTVRNDDVAVEDSTWHEDAAVDGDVAGDSAFEGAADDLNGAAVCNNAAHRAAALDRDAALGRNRDLLPAIQVEDDVFAGGNSHEQIIGRKLHRVGELISIILCACS